MISFRPITSRVATRVLRKSEANAAERTIELSKPVRRRVNLPIMLSDEPQRIRQHHAFSDPQMNRERLTRQMVEEGPSKMHLLRDVIIGQGCLMSATLFQRMGQTRRRLVLCGHPEQIEEAALCSTYFTERYFGHWLREGIAFEQLAQDQGLRAIVFDHCPWMHETRYRALLAMDPERVRLVRCNRLWVFEDTRYNGHFAERYHRVRDRLRNNVGASAPAAGRVFISRGQRACGRVLANENEVRSALVARGFELVDPENQDAEEIATVLSRARLVVGTEGSSLAHAAIAIPRGAGLLAIMGAQHCNMNYKGISDVLGFSFGFTIADALDRDRFSQPVDRLLRTIDLVDAAVEAHLDPRG